jgi:hypothetical protein
MKKSKPKPSTPPGTNSFGRTYEEQTRFEKEQKAKKLRAKDTNPLADFIGGILSAPYKAGLKAGQDFRRDVLKKKAGK